MKKVLATLLVILLIFPSIRLITPAKADELPSITLKLKNYLGNPAELLISVKGEYNIPNSDISLKEGKTYTIKVGNQALSLFENGSLIASFTSFTVAPQEYGTKNYIFINKRPYLGSMQFVIENDSYVRPINTLPVEDYLKGVVPFEMMALWNKEALKAQAVAARTYVERNKLRKLDDTITYQAYGGYAWNSNSTAAVMETSLQTLTYNGKAIDAFYCASNGGLTESNTNVWGGTPLAYLPVKNDPYDTKVPWGFNLRKVQIDTAALDLSDPQAWWNQVSEADPVIVSNIKNWLKQNGYNNNEIKIISVPQLSFLNDHTTGNRVKYGNITIQFLLKDRTNNQFVMDSNNKIKINSLTYSNTSASRIRTMLGINNMKSYLVTNVADNNTSYTIAGLGNGHGNGMSQWGAKEMADQGFTYQQILNFYYPGTILTNTDLASNPNEGTPAPVPEETGDNDKTPPIISNIMTNYITGNQQLVLQYTVNQNVFTTVYLKNLTGQIISNLKNKQTQSVGKQQLTYNASNLADGVYTFGIITTNNSQLSASSIKSVTVKKSVSKTFINTVSNKDTAVTGTAQPNVKLTISVGSKIIGSGKADAKGKFKLTIPKQKAGTTLTVGNGRILSTIIVVGKTILASPKVYAVSSKDTKVTGLTEAYATLTVKTKTKVIGTGKADGKGKYAVKIPRQKARIVLIVLAKGRAGDTSKPISFKVK